ncbi:MAG TPA: hypothetical protein VMW08_04420 [Acidimicrobiales bacterium]|nr:hypothetical protein [Acidimicrobiales bacterium]
MTGAGIMIFVLLIALPVAVLIAGAAAAPVVGWFLKTDAEQRFEGSELLETNY